MTVAALCTSDFRLRGLPSEATVEQLFAQMRFEKLFSEPEELVFGASGTPWRPSGGIRTFAGAAAGTVQVAADLRAIPTADGCNPSSGRSPAVNRGACDSEAVVDRNSLAGAR